MSTKKKAARRRPPRKPGGFRHIDAGVLVHSHPQQASDNLRELLGRLGTIKAVAEEVGATRRTVERWCAKLADLDLDPRKPPSRRAKRAAADAAPAA